MSETDVRFAALEIASELADLCRTHGIRQEWITASRDVDELVARALDQCDRTLAGASAPGSESVDAQAWSELRDLIAFARKATALRERTVPSPRVVSGVEDLERIRAAVAGADAAEAGERMADLLGEIGGLCHQINNPLTSLMGRVQILKMKPDSDAAAVTRALAVIDESARRVATHVQELGHLVGRSRERLLAR